MLDGVMKMKVALGGRYKSWLVALTLGFGMDRTCADAATVRGADSIGFVGIVKTAEFPDADPRANAHLCWLVVGRFALSHSGDLQGMRETRARSVDGSLTRFSGSGKTRHQEVRAVRIGEADRMPVALINLDSDNHNYHFGHDFEVLSGHIGLSYRVLGVTAELSKTHGLGKFRSLQLLTRPRLGVSDVMTPADFVFSSGSDFRRNGIRWNPLVRGRVFLGSTTQALKAKWEELRRGTGLELNTVERPAGDLAKELLR